MKATATARRSPAFLRFRQRLIFGLLLMAILAITLVTIQFQSAAAERHAAIRKQTAQYVQAVEAHVAYSVQFVDLSLLGFSNAIKMLPAEQAESSKTISALLSSRGAAFTRDYWITFIDARGHAVAASNNLNVVGQSYADRDYFQAHTGPTPVDGLFIGEPAIGYLSNKKLFFLSRRVEDAKGKFLGVIVAPLDAERFAHVFDDSRFSPDVSITLVHSKGKIIARAPMLDESFGRDLSQTRLFANVHKASSGTYQALSAIDKQPRVFSYRVMEHFPLIVVVGSSTEAIDRALANNLAIAVSGLTLLLGLMLAGGFFSLRTYTRQEERELRYRQLYDSSRETEAKLSLSEQRLRLIADNLPIVIAYIDSEQRYLFVNRQFDTVFGSVPGTTVGRHIKDVISADIYAQSEAHIGRALAGQNVYFERLVRDHRGERWDGVTYVADITAAGQPNGMFLMVEDITERKKSEESLKLAALMYQNSSEGMMVTDAEGRILSVNPAFSRLSGYTEQEVLGHQAYELTSGRQDQNFFSRMRQSISHSGQWEGELWHQHKQGEHYLVSLRFNTVFDQQGKPICHVGLFSDITKKKASEELIWKQANFDTLTGLPNRRMFHEHLRLEMKKTDRSQLPMALVFIDLDLFKEINDKLGHDKGDLLLQEVADRLQQCVRGSDIVARLGGDEFVIILSELRNSTDVLRIVQEILKQMSTSFHLQQDIAHISSSIGIALYPDDGDDAETLMQRADQAMYAAKQQGRNRFNYFAPFMQEATSARMALGNELRAAVSGNQLRILFQPIVNLATGKICKAEALVRWQHPQRGLLHPAEFIAIAEHTGMIVEIGDWVFEQAVDAVRRIRDSGLGDVQICVNKSVWQFRDDGSDYQLWLADLARRQLDPRSIVMEVTENLLLDPARSVCSRLKALQAAGMQVSLDDFGTGYASVAFLKRYAIDYIKIDPAFIGNLATGTDEQLLCEAIIAMAHKLRIAVVAEGVETPAQLATLQAAGCDFGQGYLFSRPIALEELEKLLKTGLEGASPVDNSLDIHRTTCE